MPRKKTVQPPPLEEITLSDGIVIEVRDDTCYLVARGSHKRDKYEEKLWKVMDTVVTDYLLPTGNRVAPKKGDYLASGIVFAKHLHLKGYGSSSGEDDSAFRKKLYHDVLRQLTIFENALKNNR